MKKQIAEFIARHNHEFQCLYFDSIVDNVVKLIDENEFSVDAAFMPIIIGDELVGYYGIDYAKELRTGYIWGPFLKTSVPVSILNECFSQMVKRVKAPVDDWCAFPACENVLVREHLVQCGFADLGEYSELSLDVSQYQSYEHDLSAELCGFDSEISETNKSRLVYMHQLGFGRTYLTVEDMQRHMSEKEDGFFFAANRNEEILGYVFGVMNFQDSEATVDYLFVLPECRRQGIGEALLDRAIRTLFLEKKLNRVQLCVRNISEDAVRLYLKKGFVCERRGVSMGMQAGTAFVLRKNADPAG